MNVPETDRPATGPQKCPQCGSPLPTGGLQGLCPACLLRQASATETGPAADAVPFQPPGVEEMSRRFPQLEILALLGKGGMGAVYQARQPVLDRLVALKILPPQRTGEPGFTDRFNREARALARLNHPNIVTIYEFGQTDGQPYFIMEYVDGLNLRQLERAGKLSPKEALQIIPQICEALQFAHDEGIVHRDIKPENILLDKKGRVKIADFGIAKLMGREQQDLAAETAYAMGTPQYMAPEQREKPQTVDHRADIFSLGVVFYEMLTGELPLGKFGPPSLKVQVDVRLDEVVLRALEQAPELRYQKISQVKTAVETIATGHAPVPPAWNQWVDYRSKTTLFGWPLVHVTFGRDPYTGKARIARGILAIGEQARGFVAVGGLACGIFSFGGLSLGVVSYGGCAAGVFAFGGFALALLLAWGGFAAGPVALGGLAAGWYAFGGQVYGIHPLGSNANDAVAMNFFEPWMRSFMTRATVGSLFATLWTVVASGLIPWWLRRRVTKQPPSNHDRTTPDKLSAGGRVAAVVISLFLVLAILLTASTCLSPSANPKNSSAAPVQNTTPPSVFQLRWVAGAVGAPDNTATSNAPVDILSFDPQTPGSALIKTPLRVLRETALDGSAIKQAGWSHGMEGRDPKGLRTIMLDFTEEGARRFEKLTAENINRQLAFIFRGRLLSAPMIMTPLHTLQLPVSCVQQKNDLEHIVQDLNRINNPMENLTLGPERQCVLPFSTATNHIWLNLSNGQLHTVGRIDYRSRELRDWLQKNGADLAAFEMMKIPTLKASDMTIDRCEADSWNDWSDATVASIRYNWSLMHNEPKEETLLVAGTNRNQGTYYFRTRDDTWGILQILGFSEQPQGVKFRYRLLTGVSQSTPSSPAEIVAQQREPTPTTSASNPAVADQPPVVVSTQPVSGARDVPPGLTEIRVRFSKNMTDKSWSWSTAWQDSAPEISSGPGYESDRRTCVVKARLEPGRTYAFWLNSDRFKNFIDSEGRPSVPYLLIFQTKTN